jgi:hypothetical protein
LADLALRLRQDKPNLSLRSIDDVWNTKVLKKHATHEKQQKLPRNDINLENPY